MNPFRRIKAIDLVAACIALLIVFSSPAAHAAALIDGAENSLLDFLVRGQSYTPTTTPHWALGTNTCSDAGTPTEPSGNGYARVSYAASLANWAGTQGAGTTVASSGTSGTTSNNNAITAPTSTGAWGTLQSVWLMTASTGGSAVICIALTSSLNVAGAGYTVSFAAGALSFQIDN